MQHINPGTDTTKHCDHECVCEDLILYIRSILPEDKCAFMACKDVIRDFKCPHDTRHHPNSTMTLPIQTCNICEIAGVCDDEFGADNYPPCVYRAATEAARKASEDVLKEQGLECWGHYQMNSKRCLKCSIAELCYTKRECNEECLRSHPQHSEQDQEERAG